MLEKIFTIHDSRWWSQSGELSWEAQVCWCQGTSIFESLTGDGSRRSLALQVGQEGEG
jgi:hypothetical protein